uniref:Uncharacterized protein n=1 Tax=Arundo donax TaxID=35708 RepID=A0A0A8ZUC6_ARUDO
MHFVFTLSSAQLMSLQIVVFYSVLRKIQFFHHICFFSPSFPVCAQVCSSLNAKDSNTTKGINNTWDVFDSKQPL